MPINFTFGMGISNLNSYVRHQSLQKKVDSGQTDKQKALAKQRARVEELEAKARKQASENDENAAVTSKEAEAEKKKLDKKSEEQRVIDSLIEYMEHNNSDEVQIRKRLSIVSAKLSGGGMVSPSDMQFIKKYDPNLYAKLCKAKAARNELAKKLKRCKTKPQVIHLRTNVTQAAIIPRSAGVRAPYTSSSSNMVTSTGVASYEYHAMSSEWNQFVRSRAYQKLSNKLKKELKKVNKTV